MIRLRPSMLCDVDFIFKYLKSDPNIMYYMKEKVYDTVDQCTLFLINNACCAILKNSAPVGLIWASRGNGRAGIGFCVAQEYWGNGYASKAIRLLTKRLLDEGMHRIWAIVHPYNAPSIRVLEKAGFSKEGVLRKYIIFPNISDEPTNVVSYSLCKGDV